MGTLPESGDHDTPPLSGNTPKVSTGVVNLLSTIQQITDERKQELVHQLKIHETSLILDQRDGLTCLLLEFHDVFALRWAPPTW